MNRNLASRLCLAIAVALLLTPAAFGQSSTTGALSGTVADQDGGALPGAVGNAVHEPTGTRYSTVTDASGRFRIANVRVGGPYTVTVTMDGFRDQSTSDVFVKLGGTVDLTFQLQLESVDETVYVVGESTPLINPTKTGSSSNIYTEALESLPTVRRSLDEFARTNPLFTVTSVNQDPDVISAGGRNSQYNNIAIDGSVNNDLFGLSDGGTPGGQSGTTPISLDAIQEVQLVLADFDVRQGGFTGGGINAITRSGSNDFKGSVFYFTRDSDFFGDGPDVLGGELRGFEEDQYGFRLGGPISQDKIFFFVNADVEERASPSGWSLDGSSGQAFAGGSLVNEANTFRDTLMNQYGYDPGGLDEDILDDPSDKYFGRVDFNISDSHGLTLRHNFVDAARDVNFPGSFTYEWPSEAYDFQTETNSTVAQLNSTLSNSMFNEARFSFQTIKDRRAPRNGIPFPWIEIEDVNGSAGGRNEFEAGTEPFSTRNALDQDILEIHDDLTWLKGDHTLTFGTHNELFTFDNLFIQNAFGSYQFSSLADFLAGRPRQFDFTVVPPGQAEAQKFDVNQLGFYVGDQWAIRDDLNLVFGLRVDIPFLPDSPTRNPFTEQTYGLRSDAIPDGQELWQPRFGFNWNPDGRGQSQLRGGAGIFAGRAPYVWISNNYARTGVEQIFITCTGSGAPDFNPDPFGQSAACASTGSIGEFNLIDPDFKLPQVLRVNLGYDRELPWWGLTASVEAVYTDGLEEIDYQNVNLTRVGTTFDGRPEYARVDPGVTGAYFITNTGEGESTQLALKVERPFRNGIWGYASYAWTDSTVVNEGTSSRAVSNFNFQEATDPNNAEASRSDFEVEHRISASLSYRFHRDSSYPTTLSLFYNHQSGRPFSYIVGSDFVAFNFGQSFNGDGTDGNDLFFVPGSAADYEVTGGGTKDQLEDFINAHPVLADNRGRLAPRNVDFAPWNHTLDLHLAQEIPVGKSHFELTFDILNLLNLLDEDSGNLRFVNFSAIEVAEVEGITADGRPIYSLANAVRFPETNSIYTVHGINSRWRAKLGLRWTF
jgi:hypothetical protein